MQYNQSLNSHTLTFCLINAAVALDHTNNINHSDQIIVGPQKAQTVYVCLSS